MECKKEREVFSKFALTCLSLFLIMHTFKIIVLFIASLQVRAVIAQTIVRGPYLQQPTAEGITIRWRTDIPTDSRVLYYSPDSSQLFSQVNSSLTTEHIITLTQLPAGTKYFYEVGTSRRILSQSRNQHFATSPLASNKQPVRFWAMGDFGASSTAKYAQNQQAVRDQFLAHKNGAVDLWVWMGDNAYCCGTDQEYQAQIFDFYGNSILGNMPILPSPGNHEYYATPTAQKDRIMPYFDIVTVPTQGEAGGVASGTKAYYSLNYGDIHFIALDSYGFDEGKYPLADTRSLQYQWLQKDLAANTSLWTIVFFHHPPYTKRSHDSDASADLIALRQTLVPLFDKYKVDLVLNGHSHVYERSYLIKGHTGHSATFRKNIHVVQSTEALYTKDSKPIINKAEGTIYIVIGSAGRLDWNTSLDPHPSSAYSNYQIGGSSIFTVDDNRLDAQWISADGQIRDQFTMFKRVNIHTHRHLEYGASTELKASWPGTYRWSTGEVNQRSIKVAPQRDTLLTVQDSLGYLTDTFLITVTPRPVIATRIDSAVNACAGQELSGLVVLANTTFDRWKYKLELSDPEGLFTTPINLGIITQPNFRVRLPAGIKEGAHYSLRVVPDANTFEVVSSNPFSISLPAEARLTDTSPLPYAEVISLHLAVEGTLPAVLKLSSLPEQTIVSSNTTIDIKAPTAFSYRIEKLANVCGTGSFDTNAVEIAKPLANTPAWDGYVMYPNPGSESLRIENRAHTGNERVTIHIFDTSGKRVFQQEVSFTNSYELDIHTLPPGIFLVEVRTAKRVWQQKIIKH